ncbi:alkaline phosphatase-like protein [Ganoderma leucocontextum]|nr:alkaline phosphatase-like protein [Ganoderma leucocontextum]
MPLRRPIWRLLIIGLIFHYVFTGTVFHCYFTTRVVHGMQQYSLPDAPAKRLVLIVGDGLRTDLLFMKNGFSTIPDAPAVVAPYLRSIAETRGAWGISHTRVPTETRPGHVALIGGMYEDVSEVTKGWIPNPIGFDSVFNQSSTTYSFGAPTVLPMFIPGAPPGKIHTWIYDMTLEDYTMDATRLDIWVFESLRTLFYNATTDRDLDGRLRAEKTVFFLHLPGLDTTGHSYRPYSKEYMKNIQVVDKIVNQTEELFREFYQDDDTAFVFTSDHGMTSIGNHGDGHPDSTRTPLIVWGKGVRGPLPDSVPSSHDPYSTQFDLSHFLRRDVDQADIALLMSALIGASWPVNAMGTLPDVDPMRPGYLLPREGERTLAQAALINAKVLLEHYRAQHAAKKMRSRFYKPYPYFASTEGTIEGMGGAQLAIEALIREGEYHQARLQAMEIIRRAQDGMHYLQVYDAPIILTIVVFAYLGWISFCAMTVLLPNPNGTTWRPYVFVMTGLAVVFAYFATQGSPPDFYLYAVFPCLFWAEVCRIANFTPFNIGRFWGTDLRRSSLRVLFTIAAVQTMVFGYTHRFVWSAWVVMICVVWPLVSWPRVLRSRHWLLLLGWTASCLALSVFPLLSVYQQEDLFKITWGALAMCLAGWVGMRNLKLSDAREARWFKVMASVLIGGLAASTVLVYLIVQNLRAKQGVPANLRTPGWIILILNASVPFIARFGMSDPNARLLSFFLGIGAWFIWVAVSVEGLFYVTYSLALYFWVEVESIWRAKASSGPASSPEDTNKVPSAYRPWGDDLRIALFFLLFMQIAYFGPGNVPSIASFYLDPIYRLVSKYNPYLVLVLLMFKMFAPYILLALAFSILHARLNVPPFRLFIIALALADVMNLTFFLKVTHTGSWDDISRSFSNFCTSSLLVLWATVACVVGEFQLATRPPQCRSDGGRRHDASKS